MGTPADQREQPKLNGKMNGERREQGEEDTSEEEEEMEPVSATLVLRVVNESPSPSLARKQNSNLRGRSQPPSFLSHEDYGDTFLQVQVQRSSSSSSLAGPRNSRPPSMSRAGSATPSFYTSDHDNNWGLMPREYGISRDTSRESSVSPTPSMYGTNSMDPYKHRLNPVEILQRVEQNTRAMEEGIRELRQGVDTPNRLLEFGQETVVLSGLSRQAGDSLKHIKNLYEETKYLKSYLEQLEAKAHYDMVVRCATPYRPPWYRRLVFLVLLGSACLYTWHRADPQGCSSRVEKLGGLAKSGLESVREFFTSPAARVDIPTVIIQ